MMDPLEDTQALRVEDLAEIAMLTANITAQYLELEKAGKLRILSVSSESRLKAAPHIPTSIESGLPGMVAQTTFAILASQGRHSPT